MDATLMTQTREPTVSDADVDVPASRQHSLARARQAVRNTIRLPLRWVLLVVLLMLIVYPIYWIAATALQDPFGALNASSLVETWSDAENLRALRDSVIYALSTAVLSTLIAVPLAWIYRFSDLRGKWLIPISAITGFALPSYCIAISYLLLLGPNTGLLSRAMNWSIGWAPDIVSFGGMVTLSTLHLWPMAFLIVSASLGQMDESLRDASRTVGARDLRTIFRVELPMIRPAIMSGFILVYIYTLVLFSVPLLVGLPSGNVVLTTAIFREFSSAFPDLPAASALSLLFLLATVPAVILSRRATRRGRFTTGHTGQRRLVKLPIWSKVIAYVGVGLVLMLSAWIPLFHFGVLSLSDVWHDPSAGLTDDNFKLVFDSTMFLRSLENTLIYAVTTSVLVTLLAALIGYVLRQRMTRGLRATFETLTVAPYAIPGVVLAIGYILGFGREPFTLVGTMLLLILAYTGHFIPVGFQALQPVFQQLDPDWDDAARTSGAKLFRRLRTVLLPLLTPGLVSSGILVFISVAKELPLTVILSSGRTLGISSLTIQTFEDGSFARLGALGLVLIVVVLVATGAARIVEARLINGRRNKYKTRAKA